MAVSWPEKPKKQVKNLPGMATRQKHQTEQRLQPHTETEELQKQPRPVREKPKKRKKLPGIATRQRQQTEQRLQPHTEKEELHKQQKRVREKPKKRKKLPGIATRLRQQTEQRRQPHTEEEELHKHQKPVRAQQEKILKDHKDLANTQRKKFDRQQQQLKNQDENRQRQQVMQYEKEQSLKVLQAQPDQILKEHEDLANIQRKEYDPQLHKLKNQEEKKQRQQVMQYEKEQRLKVPQAQPEQLIKEHEDLANTQREEYDRQLQQLKNQEEKQPRHQVVQYEKEQRLQVLPAQPQIIIKEHEDLANTQRDEYDRQLQQLKNQEEKQPRHQVEQYEKEQNLTVLPAQPDEIIKEHEDLANIQREDYDQQLQQLKNQEGKQPSQQVMLYEKEQKLKVLQAQLEQIIKEREELANIQRVDYDRQLQQLKNHEEKQERQQEMRHEKEQRLKVLQEKLGKQKTELEFRDRQQQVNTESNDKQQKDLVQLRQPPDVKVRDWKQLEGKLSEQQQEHSASSEALDEGSEGSDEIPDEEVLNLLRVLTTGMKKIEDEVGSFSYEFGKNMQLTAYINDSSKTVGDMLQEKLRIFLQKHISERYVRVTVYMQSPDIRLCSLDSGSQLQVCQKDRRPYSQMTLGSYFQYGNEETVYWVSCAHGVMLPPGESNDNHQSPYLGKDFSIGMHENNEPRIQALLNIDQEPERWVDLPTPYIYLNYNPTARRDGFIIEHSVDILIGPTPLTRSLIENPGGRCFSTADIRYFMQVDKPTGEVIFNAQKLVQERTNVFFYLKGGIGRQEGNVVSVSSKLDKVKLPSGVTVDAHHMVKIEPNASSKPEDGQSGSIWLQKTTKDSLQAVAITCAVGKDLVSGKEFWLASLLCASLLGLSKEYPSKFADPYQFRSLTRL